MKKCHLCDRPKKSKDYTLCVDHKNEWDWKEYLSWRSKERYDDFITFNKLIEIGGKFR